MTPADQWQESNARQLAAALAALRERLERFARQFDSAPKPAGKPAPPAPATTPAPAPAQPPPSGTMSRSLFQRLLRAPATKPVAPEPATVAADSTNPGVAAQPSVSQSSAGQPASPAEPPSALDMLGERLGLSAFERNVLLLCAGLELDTRIAGLCARASRSGFDLPPLSQVKFFGSPSHHDHHNIR